MYSYDLERYCIFAFNFMIIKQYMQHRIHKSAKPFVKWAGGKTKSFVGSSTILLGILYWFLI